MNRSTIYIYEKDEAKRNRLVDDYAFLGYYVSVVGDRVRVSSVAPPKPTPKKKFERKPREARNV